MRLLAVLASAALWTLAFPPRAWWPVAWVGIVPLLVAIRTAPGVWGALGLAWLWCLAFAWCIGAWLPGAVGRYFEQPPAVGAAAFLVTATVTAAWQYAAFAALHRALARRYTRSLPLLAAAAFTVAELVRVRGPTSDPWGLVGYSQGGAVVMSQIADLTGVYGVTFVVVAVNVALAELWLARRDPTRRRATWHGLGVALLPALLVAAYGGAQLDGPAGPPAPPGYTTVALVQGDVATNVQWRASDYGKHLDVYLDLTRSVLGREPVALVVWPESAMTFFPDDEVAYRRAIALVTGPRHAQLLAGAPHADDAKDGVFFNSAYLLAPDGDVLGRYDKGRLLPFAEYDPLAIDLVRRRVGRVRRFTSGTQAALLDSVAGPAGVLICNEGFYGNLAAARARAGATWLVNLTNDSWVADPQFAGMALDMVRMRAIEQRRWLVRASTWGASAVIDPLGRVVSESTTGARATVVGTIASLDGTTPYARLGDAFAVICALVVAAALLRGPRRA